MTGPSRESWWGRGGMGDRSSPGWEGWSGRHVSESMGGQAVKLKSEIHWTPKAFGDQALQPWGGTELGWGTGLWGVQAPWSPHPMPYSAE